MTNTYAVMIMLSNTQLEHVIALKIQLFITIVRAMSLCCSSII